MPDAQGWHSTSFTGSDGHLYRWHYCKGLDKDACVLDTPEARHRHEQGCERRRKAEVEKRERERIRANAERLRTLNRLRREKPPG